MLVLSRKMGQSIVIDDNIVVTVLRVRGRTVRIGIQAPTRVSVRREAAAAPNAPRVRPERARLPIPSAVGPRAVEPAFLPATQDIAATVTDELTKLGATIFQCQEGYFGLYVRSVLPRQQEVRSGDVVQGGIAVRSVDREIQVCHYVFRKVCTNGALAMLDDFTCIVDRVDVSASLDVIEQVHGQLRDAVRQCADPAADAAMMETLTTAAETPADLGGQFPPAIARVGLAGQRALRTEVLHRFLSQQDRSVYGLMNAITSVARDEADPETRWRLEELGGAIAAKPPRPLLPDATDHAVGRPASHSRKETSSV